MKFVPHRSTKEGKHHYSMFLYEGHNSPTCPAKNAWLGWNQISAAVFDAPDEWVPNDQQMLEDDELTPPLPSDDDCQEIAQINSSFQQVGNY